MPCPAGFFEPDTATAFEAGLLVNARRPDGAVFELCLLRLRDSQVTRDLWLKACAQQRNLAGGRGEAWRPKMEIASGADTYLCRNWPVQNRTLCLIRRGRYLVLADGRRSGGRVRAG